MVELWAIKDENTGYFYAGAKKGLQELNHNTILHKNKATAEHQFTARSSFHALRRICRVRAVKEKFCRDRDYINLNLYFEQHKDDYKLKVVKIEVNEK